MFSEIVRGEEDVLISDGSDMRIMPIATFEKARGRKAWETDIRKSILIVVDAEEFVFMQSEWEEAQRMAVPYLKSCLIEEVRRKEIMEKVLMSPLLAKQRNDHLIRQANKAAMRLNELR